MFSRFWTSVVQVDVVEQMNKKVDLTRVKKLPPVIVGLIFYQNAPTKNEGCGLVLSVYSNIASSS